MEESLIVQAEESGAFLILHFKGKLDALSSPIAEKKTFEYINKGHYKLIFDFSGIQFLSSAGMRMLLSTTKKLKALSGILILCCLHPNVNNVLHMSGFDHVLVIVNTIEDAQKLIEDHY